MKNTTRALVAALVSIILVIGGAPAAQAADTQPPELVSIVRTSPARMNRGTLPEVLVDARDDSGIRKIVVHLGLVGPEANALCATGPSVAYPFGDRPWPVGLSVYCEPREDHDPLTVIVESVELTDSAGNVATVTDRSLLDPLEFRIEDPSRDKQAPTLVSLEVEPAVAVPGQPVTVRTTLADAAPSAWSSHYPRRAPGLNVWAGGIDVVETRGRDNGDGTFTSEVVYQVSRDTLYGSYPLDTLTLEDKYRNTVTIPTDAALVVDDPAHPMGDLKLLGNFTVGHTLTASTPGWDPKAKITYEWYQDGHSPQPGAASHRLEGRYFMRVVSVRATATWPDGTVRVRYAWGPRIEPGVLDLGRPTVGGTLRVGGKATASYPALDPKTYAKTTQHYQWLRDGVPIAGAQATSYVPVPADRGRKLSVQVTTHAEGYAAFSATSTQSVVAPGVLATSPPRIVGTPRVGGTTLNLTYDDWTAGTTMSYQWQRNGVNIPGATSPHYPMTPADIGQSIRVGLTGTKPGYQTVTRYSVAVTPVAGVLVGPTPKITGTPRVGVSLQAVPGIWTAGTTLKYQWQRNGVNIPGATSAKYAPTAKDRGQSIRLRITGTKPGYHTRTKHSATVKPVAGVLVGPTPKITGTPRVGTTLNAVPGTWTAGTTLKYQWQRNGVNIPGATSATYRPAAKDRAATIGVRVSGTKTGYTPMSKTSVRVRVR